ncbi:MULTISPECIES: hypothetical protein [Bradyrhizobium]|jgi:hypothetical protein|uniref:hypothetical protein n=1 Tax=Bradyrhizobium TaxID=374 RepID=UPI000424A697|nr:MULTISPECIES: hypothetical protein [Bradyrhizobium]
MGVLARRDVASLIFQATHPTRSIYFAASMRRRIGRRDACPTDQARISARDGSPRSANVQGADGEQTKLCCSSEAMEHVFDPS